MNSLEYYYKTIIKYDLINKFSYSNIKKIPELKKIVLNFGCKSSEIKELATSLLALELIINTNTPIFLTKSKQPNVLLKIRKGAPVGCKVILKKKTMYDFFLKLITEILPNLKNFEGINFKKSITNSNFSFTLKNLVTFKELETYFYLFEKLPPLNITIITNTSTKKELFFLINSFKLPLL